MARDTWLRRLLPLGLAVVLGACGKSPAPTATEPWPVMLQAPGVVGYAVLRPPADFVEGVCTQLLGFAPAGLDPARPLTMISIDAKSFGGSYAWLLPLRDEAAFRTSFDSAPGMRSAGRGDYVLDVPADSDLGRFMLFGRSLTGGPGTFGQVMQAIQNAGPQSLSFHVAAEDGWALVAPTFEATAACRDVLRETGGFVQSPPQAFVVSSDFKRVRVVYAAEIQNLENQLRALIGGAQVAGLASLASSMHGGDRAPLGMGVKWEFLWALKDMLDVSRTFDGLQITLRPHAADLEEHASDGSETAASRYLASLFDKPAGSARVQLAPGTPLAAFTASLRPAPELPGALVFACDGPAFGRALADWMRPLGELAKGEGPPCDRYLDEAAELFSGFGGTLAVLEVDGETCLLASGADVTPERLLKLRAWAAPIVAAAGGDASQLDAAAFTTRELAEGRVLLVATDGTPLATVGRRADIVWLCRGESNEPDAALTSFARALAVPPSATAPSMCLRSEVVDIDLRATDDELVLDVRRRDDDGR